MFVFCTYHDKVLQRVFDGYMSYSMSDSVLLAYQISQCHLSVDPAYLMVTMATPYLARKGMIDKLTDRKPDRKLTY